MLAFLRVETPRTVLQSIVPLSEWVAGGDPGLFSAVSVISVAPVLQQECLTVVSNLACRRTNTRCKSKARYIESFLGVRV